MAIVETHEEAIDEINTMLLDAWTDSPETQLIPIVWGDVVAPKKGIVDYFNGTEPYLRTELLHETSRTVSLKGPSGTKREHRGTLATLLHIQGGKGYAHAMPLISVAQDAFTGTRSPGGVWFRNPQLTNIGRQGTWYIMSMTVTFIYDLIK